MRDEYDSEIIPLNVTVRTLEDFADVRMYDLTTL